MALFFKSLKSVFTRLTQDYRAFEAKAIALEPESRNTCAVPILV
jgi:hypothetical protein